MSESGQSDRIPPTQAIEWRLNQLIEEYGDGALASTSIPDLAEWLTHEREGWPSAAPPEPTPAVLCPCGFPWPCDLHADPNMLSAAPPEPPLDVDGRDRTVENLIIALAYRYDDDAKGTPCFCVAVDARYPDGTVEHTPRCRSARITLERWRGGTAPDRLPSVEALSDFDLAMLKAAIVREEQRRWASLHEGTAPPDGGGE